MANFLRAFSATATTTSEVLTTGVESTDPTVETSNTETSDFDFSGFSLEETLRIRRATTNERVALAIAKKKLEYEEELAADPRLAEIYSKIVAAEEASLKEK